VVARHANPNPTAPAPPSDATNAPENRCAMPAALNGTAWPVSATHNGSRCRDEIPPPQRQRLPCLRSRYRRRIRPSSRQVAQGLRLLRAGGALCGCSEAEVAVISPVVQAVLDAALAWADDRECWTCQERLEAAVAVYRATQTPTRPCTTCVGRGFIPGWTHKQDRPCSACGGSGVAPTPETTT
jgi:hypothetical protein